MFVDPRTISRAEGCLLGQLAGDSLGSHVEFQSPNKSLATTQTGFENWPMVEHGTPLQDSRPTIPK